MGRVEQLKANLADLTDLADLADLADLTDLTDLTCFLCFLSHAKTVYCCSRLHSAAALIQRPTRQALMQQPHQQF